MRRNLTALLIAICVCAIATPAAFAAPSGSAERCLSSTGRGTFDPKTVMTGIEVAPEYKRDLQLRLLMWFSSPVTGGQFTPVVHVDRHSLLGLGLTTAQQQLIRQRIAEQVAASTHPIGWPCTPFTNRSRVIAFVRDTLIYNGFRPAMSFEPAKNSRQIVFHGVQDGEDASGMVVKTGPRQVTIGFFGHPTLGHSALLFEEIDPFTVNFDA